jgi:molybdopterin-guanine dinucleotide biosynthesis protein A
MAGGKSTRMGRDKSFVPLLGKPMIEHVIERVVKLADDLIIITNKPADYAHLSLPTFGDIHDGYGPLGGLHSALFHASRSHVLVVACDMPWLNRQLLAYMISLRLTADVIVPRWQKFPEPLHAVYSKSCLTPIEACLEAQRLKLISFYDSVDVSYLDQKTIVHFDSDGRSFANLNTPEELADASGL